MRRVCLLLLLAAGCSAQRTLYTPTEDERAMLAEPPLRLRVSVIHWTRKQSTGQSPFAYSSHLAELMAKSGTFSSTIYDSTGTKPADLFALPTHDYCNTAALPFLTILTVGFVPTVWKEEQCDGAVFRSARSDSTSDSVVVRVHYGGTQILGWFAAPLGLLPGWSYHSGRDQPSYQQAFRLAVLRRRDELLALAASAPGKD